MHNSGAKQAREEGIISLFRAVGIKEVEQIRATGRFAPSPVSMNGKWFAETPQDAARWGQLLEGPGKYIVVEAEMPARVADTLFSIAKLDAIGPARYVEADQLGDVRVVGEVGD